MSDEKNRQFGGLDWAVFASMLTLSMGIGIFYALYDRQKKSSNFMMGGRHMQLLPIAISMILSFMSAVVIIGTPAEIYTTGTMFFVAVVGVVLALFVSAVTFVPLLYPLKLISSFEYLELRFNSKAARLTGTLIMNVQQVLVMATTLFAPSTALGAVTGFPVWATIITGGCASTFYTFLGGMKAVIWTDFLQSLFLYAGLLAILIQGTMEVGSLSNVWEINDQWGRIDFWETDPSLRHSIWSLVIGLCVHWVSRYGISQPIVQRYTALPTLNKAKASMFLNAVFAIVLFTTTCSCGIIMFAFYANKGCDPLLSRKISHPNHLVPFFVMEILGYPGMPGLFIACLFSGSLSTMSSSLNSLSAVTWEDCVKPLLGNRFNEGTKTWIIKTIVLLYGAAGIGIAFLIQNFGGTIIQVTLSFDGAAAGPLLGIFALGAFFPWANWIGCVVGGFVGLALPLWISFGSITLPRAGFALDFPTSNCSNNVINKTIMTTTLAPEPTGLQNLYGISYLWLPPIGLMTSLAVGLVLSCITGPMRIGDTDPKYLIPVFDRLCCCLPKSWRRTLQCNQRFQHPEDVVPDDFDTPEKNVTENKFKSYKDVEIRDMAANRQSIPAIISYKRSLNKEFVYDNSMYDGDVTHTYPYRP